MRETNQEGSLEKGKVFVDAVVVPAAGFWCKMKVVLGWCLVPLTCRKHW